MIPAKRPPARVEPPGSLVGPAEAVTARLLCRRPPATSGSDYRRLFMNPAIEAWLRPSPMAPFVPADLERLLRHDRSHWQMHGFGPWALADRLTGEFAGRAGLAWTRIGGLEVVELPWAIRPEFQRRGLATESALAAIDTARRIGLGKVVSLALVENRASRGVMEKIGLRYVRDLEHVGLPHALYELNYDRWPGRVWLGDRRCG